MIPESDWKWFGHSVVVPNFTLDEITYDFHLCTVVGKYVIITVGDPLDSKKLVRDLGENYNFKTAVYTLDRFDTCGCPVVDCLITRITYSEHREANVGHITVCKSFASKE